MPKQILVVEDDPEIAALVGLHLRDQGWEVERAADGRSALARVRRGGWDLVVLDLMLPDLDGLEVCRAIRAREGYCPVLILTARSSEVDRVVGLELGADDYLTKPFSVRELVARVRALFRRAEAMALPPAAEDLGPVEVFGLALDPSRRKAIVGGRPVSLTAREFDLLLHFARHPGRVFTRAQLLERVWGYGHEGYEHTVNTHINRLRAKIEADPAHPRYVLTVWGVGYKFPDRDDWAGG
ncbi:MAG: response regulator transcription factor [Deferrisomatales bacterium]